MKTEKSDTYNIEQKNSTRHHYIPKFLIEGFKNSEGLLYVFDKEKNKILKNPRSPKSIFFEDDRNTVELTETLESSVLEDVLYSKIDNESSPIVKQYQKDPLNEIKFAPEDNAKFLFFLITLFWRIPNTDFAAEDVMNRTVISSSGIDPKVLQNDPTFRKMQRAGLFKHQIDEMIKFGKKGTKWVNIHQSGREIYVIGDNPILFKTVPGKFSEFNDIDFLIAVSSNRIFSSTNSSFKNLTEINSIRYNAAVINQSTRYVGCSNLEALNQSIQLYTELKSLGLQSLIAERVFETK